MTPTGFGSTGQRWIAVIAMVEALAIVVLLVMLAGGAGPVVETTSRSATHDAVGDEGEGLPPNEPPNDRPGDETFASSEGREGEAGAAIDGSDGPLGLLLYGEITTDDGSPAGRGRVMFRDDAGEHVAAQVAESGAYTTIGLRPGTWRLLTRFDGLRPLDREIELASEPEVRRLDLELERAFNVRVKVTTPKGEPIREALRDALASPFDADRLCLVVTEEPPTGDFPMTANRSQHRLGRARFVARRRSPLQKEDPLAPEYIGEVELEIDPPAHVSLVFRHVVIETRPITPTTEEVEFVVAADRIAATLSGIKGRVVDAATGDPIEASVNVSDRQSGGPSRKTGEDGTFEWTGLAPGIMDVAIHAKDRARRHHYVVLPKGDVVDLGTVRLHASLAVEGQVVGPDGEGVRANVFWRNLEEMTFPQPLYIGGSRQSGTDGTFTMNVGPGRYVVHVRRRESDLLAIAEVRVTTGQERPVLRLAETAPLKLETQFGPTDYCLLRILDERGLPVVAGHFFGSWTRTLRLPPGTYRFEAWNDGALRPKRTFTLPAGGATLDVP